MGGKDAGVGIGKREKTQTSQIGTAATWGEGVRKKIQKTQNPGNSEKKKKKKRQVVCPNLPLLEREAGGLLFKGFGR